MKKIKSGGGYNSNKRVETKVRAGPARTNIVDKTAVSHLGNAIGSHITEGGDVKRPKYPIVKGTAPQVRSGNDVAASTVCGPGGSRNIYKTGRRERMARLIPALRLRDPTSFLATVQRFPLPARP
jgi:hypothetical protein